MLSIDHGRHLFAAVALLVTWIAPAGAQTPPAIPAEGYAQEAKDWGVAAIEAVKKPPYRAPTPMTLPGGKVVSTLELKTLLEQPNRPFLIDVVSGPAHRTLPGAIWMNNGGLGDFDREEEKRFHDTIERFTGGDRQRQVVVFCTDSECWLSYNAALRMAQAGYKQVMWYRGGIAAWRTANLPTQQADPFPW